MIRSTPLVSVVIPTFNRPQYLPRAINSALEGMDSKDIEVIVVPNGPDQSWREPLDEFKNNPSVRVIPVPEANANVARNTGMANACGEFIRFLDDDDYLIPEGAIKQYELIKSSGADVVSGKIELLNQKGQFVNLLTTKNNSDLNSAVFSFSTVYLPHAYVYKYSSIKDILWNPKTKIRQDFEWLIDICSQKELKWIGIEDVVGVWLHHSGQRISTAMDTNNMNKHTVPMLMKAYELMLKDGRLTISNRQAISQGLWFCIHASFFIEPSYWIKIAKISIELDPTSRPSQPIYSYPFLNHISPITIQWLLLPKRWIFYYWRKFFSSLIFKTNGYPKKNIK